MRRIAGEGVGGEGITMPAQHRDVCQSSAMDEGIVYRPNPNARDAPNQFLLKLMFHLAKNQNQQSKV